MPRTIAAAHTTPPNASISHARRAASLVRGGGFASRLADDADGERDRHEHARQQHDDADLPECCEVDVIAERREDHVVAAAGGTGAREIHLHLDHVVGADRVASRQDHESSEDRDRDGADDERSANAAADELRPAVGCGAHQPGRGKRQPPRDDHASDDAPVDDRAAAAESRFP